MALKHMCTTYNPLAGDDPIFSQAISRNHGYQAILWSHLQPQVFEANFPRLRQTFAVLLAIFRRGWLTSVLRISSKRRQAEIELINRMTFAATDYAHGIIGGRKASAEFLSATGLFPSIHVFHRLASNHVDSYTFRTGFKHSRGREHHRY